MAVSDTTVLQLLGKYVTFKYSIESKLFDHRGVVSAVVIELDGSHQIALDVGDFYFYSDLVDLKVNSDLSL